MNEIMFFVQPEYLGYFWLILAIVFLFIEIGTPGLFFFIAFAIGCGFASILAFTGFSFVVQCVFGLTVSILSFFILRHYFSVKTKGGEIETNVDALVGQKGIVIKTINPHEIGQVKVGGESWSAQNVDDHVLQKGMVVSVVRVKGNRLVVKSLD